MDMKFDPHNFSGMIKGMVQKLESNKYGLQEENRKLILEFYLHLRSQGYKDSRICKYLTMLKLIDKRITKPFNKLTKDDVKEFVIGIESADYSNWTKHDYKFVIRSLFKWMKGNNESYPDFFGERSKKVWIKKRTRRPLKGEYEPRDKTLIINLEHIRNSHK